MWNLVFIHMQVKTNFHMKGWADLALKLNIKRKKSVPSDIQTLRSGLKKRGAAAFFQPTSKMLICINFAPHNYTLLD